MEHRLARVALATIAALLLLVPGIASQPLRISEIIVSGVPEPEARRIKSLLPFAEGSAFASIEKARRLAAFAKAYLEQDEGFAGVDIEVEEIEAETIGVYIHPRPSTIASLSVFGFSMTTIPNIPFYGVGTGFSVAAEEQLLGLDLPLARWASADFAAGHAVSADSEQALSAKAGLSLKPLPLFSGYAFAGLDAYLGDDPWPRDAYGQGGARLDLGFLSRLVLFGPSFEALYRRGFLDYSYSAIGGGAAFAFRPFSFFRTEAKADLYFVTGTAAPLATLPSAGTRELRLPTDALPDTGGLASISLTGYLALPLKLRLGVATLSFSLFGFVEASEPYIDLAELRRIGIPKLSATSPATGGGLLLEFSPPFSLSFEIGCGYSLDDDEFAFLLKMT